MNRANECAFPSVVGDPGLTVREHLAALAMQGLMANRSFIDNIDRESASYAASKACMVADALLAELAKPVTP